MTKKNNGVHAQHMTPNQLQMTGYCYQTDSTHTYNFRPPKATVSKATQTVNSVVQPAAMPRQTNYPVRMPSWGIILIVFLALLIPIAVIYGSDQKSIEYDNKIRKIKSEKDDYKQMYEEKSKLYERDSDYFNNIIKLLEQKKEFSQVEIEQMQRHLDECREERNRCSQRKEKLDDALVQCQKDSNQNQDQWIAEQGKQKKELKSVTKNCQNHINEINKKLEECQNKKSSWI